MWINDSYRWQVIPVKVELDCGGITTSYTLILAKGDIYQRSHTGF